MRVISEIWRTMTKNGDDDAVFERKKEENL
jgi:hypothetical protein